MSDNVSAQQGAEPRISVCVAAYNGEKYIREQIDSILAQLGPDDEVIVVDDRSTDGTRDVLARIPDRRVQVVEAEVNRGYVKTFERALTLSRGEYVFLADQDDIWVPGRVDTMVQALAGSLVVASNFTVFGGDPNRFHGLRLRARDSGRHIANLLTLWIGIRPYYGCAMALRREAKAMVLPFPAFLTETHDQWIAMCGNVAGSIAHVEMPTVERRLHSDNTTPKRSRKLAVILKARWMLAKAFAVALRRRNAVGRSALGRSA